MFALFFLFGIIMIAAIGISLDSFLLAFLFILIFSFFYLTIIETFKKDEHQAMTEQCQILAKKLGYTGFSTRYDFNSNLRIDTFHELFACKYEDHVIVLPLNKIIYYSSAKTTADEKKNYISTDTVNECIDNQEKLIPKQILNIKFLYKNVPVTQSYLMHEDEIQEFYSVLNNYTDKNKEHNA